MPVDPFGKLIPRNPADRYAKPINRKPKRRKKRLDLFVLYGSFVFVCVLTLYSAIKGQPQTHPAAPPIWVTTASWQGANSTEVGPAETSGTWHFTWTCPVTDNAMSMRVLDEQGNPLLLKNVACTSNDHTGSATVTYTGNVHIGISAVGSWTMSIQEPYQ